MNMHTFDTQVPALIETPEWEPGDDMKTVLAFYCGGEATAQVVTSKVFEHIKSFRASFAGDATTEKGRDEIKRFVRRITRTRTLIDDTGLALNRVLKEQPKQVDSTRKLIRDQLEKWEAEVRKPVTDWEVAEKTRVDAIKARLAELQNIIADVRETPSTELKAVRASLDQDVFTPENFGEYLEAAFELRATAIERLETRIASAVKREEERAELEAFRKQKEADEQAARDERIRQEGIKAAEDAARAKAEAEVKKQLDEANAKLAEAQQKLAAPTPAPTAPPFVSAPNPSEERQKLVNRTARDALVSAGIDVATAQKVIELIARRKVPNVTIHY